jgi:hypothetical protein
MHPILEFVRRKFRKQFQKYWQRSIPWRTSTLRRGFPRFVAEYAEFRAKAVARPHRFDLAWRDRLPCLDDNTDVTPYEPSYLYPLAWAARGIAHTAPDLHTDVGSAIEFSALVSPFARVERYAREPIEIDLPTLKTMQANLAALPLSAESVLSLSCLSVVERQGLGRFGEPLNPGADLEIMEELRRILGPGGALFLSVPVGQQRILFNSHRIYSAAQIASLFSSEFEIQDFALVDDKGHLLEHATFSQADAQENGIGCWWFRKPR